jgi:hypothetical protein
MAASATTVSALPPSSPAKRRRVTNLPPAYLTGRDAGATVPGWKNGTFAASAGRRRRSCGVGRC